MCGICGIRRFGKEPISPEAIKSLLIQLESRGNDATGLAIQNGDQIHVLKKDVPAWSLVTSDDFKAFLDAHLTDETQTVIGHTRWATKGDPAKLGNNHPLYAGNAAIVHNGTISNDDTLFREMKLKREAETDSDVIRAIVDGHEGRLTQKLIRDLEKLRGSCASAIITCSDPEHFLLLRSGSPLVIASTDEHLMWASTKEALHMAARRWVNRFGVWQSAARSDLVFATVHPDTALLFGPKGLEWHQEFKSLYYTYVKPSYDIHNVDRRLSRQRRMRSNTSVSVPVVPPARTMSSTSTQTTLLPNDDDKEETQHSSSAVSHGSSSTPVLSRDSHAFTRFIQCRNPKCPVWMDMAVAPSRDSRELQCPTCSTPLRSSPRNGTADDWDGAVAV